MLLHLLWAGEREAALKQLQSLLQAGVDVPFALLDAIRCLETQHDWIGNYDDWEAQGYLMGSGLVERAVAVVMNLRMKKRGMRWKQVNASAVVALWVQHIKAEWESAA